MKQEGCCSSFKWEIDDPSSGQSITVARHGTAADDDELWAELPCDLDEKVRSKKITNSHLHRNLRDAHCQIKHIGAYNIFRQMAYLKSNVKRRLLTLTRTTKIHLQE